jgi:hypothetical protein
MKTPPSDCDRANFDPSGEKAKPVMVYDPDPSYKILAVLKYISYGIC